jgi:hypothetical protein
LRILPGFVPGRGEEGKIPEGIRQPGFLPKSPETLEKKRVEFLVRAKKTQKSAQECEKKELEYCG